MLYNIKETLLQYELVNDIPELDKYCEIINNNFETKKEKAKRKFIMLSL